jgi:cytidylate kinase
MSVITISRGTFSGGKALAECLSRQLGYRCIDRDVIVEKAAARRVSETELRAVLEEAPVILGRFSHKRYIYLTLIQAALAEEVRNGCVIYHGLGGHLLLGRAPGILRLRIIAPAEFRIRMAQERMGLSRSEVIAYIDRIDQDRRKWTQYLYGVDWADPALYDFVINLEHVTVEQSCGIVAGMIEQRCFEFSPECQAALNDLALASRVRAELALSPFTSNLEVDVEARGGSVSIKGELFEQFGDVEQVARSVPGVTGLTVEDLAPADHA